jgi:hypothetical protein
MTKIPSQRVVASNLAGLSLLAVGLVVLSACGGHRLEPPASGLAASLERGIGVSEDLTVFTLFALLNAAGYDDENREAGMHPVRLQVRQAVQQQLSPGFQEELRRFYDEHKQHASPWSYSVVAKATAGPPSFAPTAEWTQDLAQNPRFGPLSGLHGLLRRFYLEIPVQQLYEPVRPAYHQYIQRYRDAIFRETAAALQYCRVNLTELTASVERKNPVVIPNLLDSYERASSFNLDERFISVEGPQERIGYNPHEFVHAVTNPTVDTPATEALRDQLGPLMEEGLGVLRAPSSRYPTLAAFVDENLVRTISLRYLVPRRPERERELQLAMMGEWKSGYSLMRFFWEQLILYEQQAADLRQYYPTMLSRLDPANELARWRAARTQE